MSLYKADLHLLLFPVLYRDEYPPDSENSMKHHFLLQNNICKDMLYRESASNIHPQLHFQDQTYTLRNIERQLHCCNPKNLNNMVMLQERPQALLFCRKVLLQKLCVVSAFSSYCAIKIKVDFGSSAIVLITGMSVKASDKVCRSSRMLLSIVCLISEKLQISNKV